MRGVFFHLLKSTRNRRPFVQFHASTTPSPSSSFPALPNHHHLNIRPYFRSPFLSKNHISSSSSTSVAAAAATNGLRNGLISWYLGMIEARPVLTKSITAGVIFTAADVSSQMITLTPSDSFDPIRTLRMAGYGMLISGPSLHLWFNFASKLVPKRDLFSTLKKMILGQTVYGPIMTAIFFSSNAAVQGESGAEIVARLKRDMIPTLINGLVYWPVCDFITFRYIPVRLQPLVSNSFSFLWTIYITYMASLKKVNVD
ncbi:hypothetical protein MRB53_007052 [Persea americana]|uniref:Uncharacterized protein n=1 Tax=Persea americana TaxID=3435 RepID=A0ACC2MI55_PERAE|nr:hypothetical protein MRB53_007052 [Persea americana]